MSGQFIFCRKIRIMQMKRKKLTCHNSETDWFDALRGNAEVAFWGTHEYGAQNRCFYDPPRPVIDYLPASVQGQEQIQTSSLKVNPIQTFIHYKLLTHTLVWLLHAKAHFIWRFVRWFTGTDATETKCNISKCVLFEAAVSIRDINKPNESEDKWLTHPESFEEAFVITHAEIKRVGAPERNKLNVF